MLEMLAAIALVALLAALATPSFRQLHGRLALRAATHEVMAGLALARGTALATGSAVTICPTADEIHCGFAASGWMIFINAPGGTDARREPQEAILRRWRLPPRVQVTGSRGYVTYLPELRAATTATLIFGHAGLPGAAASIIVSQTGRPRLSSGRPST
jgi:type IV fimbrial biogenesis protein FimT